MERNSLLIFGVIIVSGLILFATKGDDIIDLPFLQIISVNPDPDGDGITTRDICQEIPETFNTFEDIDGCPDIAPTGITAKHLRITQWSHLIERGQPIMIDLGVQNFENTENILSIKIKANGETKETFPVPQECLSTFNSVNIGWDDCSTTLVLDWRLYPAGSYQISVGSADRTELLVPLEIFNIGELPVYADETPEPISEPVPEPEIIFPVPEPTKSFEEILQDILTSQGSSPNPGIRVNQITESDTAPEFTQDDLMIIIVLVVITLVIAVIAKEKKKT